MPRELKNAKINFVSYVDKAANKKKFFMTKSSEPPTFQKEVKLIAKAEDEKKLVYGVVYEPDIADAHGDFMTAEEIQKAAHGFLKMPGRSTRITISREASEKSWSPT